MKLSSSLLLLTFLQVSAHVNSQDKLTVNVKNIGWQPFFDLLEKKSSYTFLYKDNVLPHKEKIDVAARDLTVPQILDNVLSHSPLTYQLLPNHLIVIIPRAEATGMTGPPGMVAAAGDIRITGRVVSVAGDALAGAGYQNYRLVTRICAALLNFGLNLILIPRFSWLGAAWASLATDGGLGVIDWIVIRWLISREKNRSAPILEFA